MALPFYIARRLSLSSGGKKSSPAIVVAITAVALSIAVMLASIAIVLGFKREIREKVTGFNSHITLYSIPQADNDNLVSLTPSMRGLLDKQDYINDYSLEASIPAIMKTSDNFKGVYLKSLGGGGQLQFIRDNLEEGKVPDFSKEGNELEVVISRIATNQLNLKAGEKIDTYFITDEVRVRPLKIAGIYNSHFDSYDDIYIFGNLGLIQKLGGIESDKGTTLLISVDDFNQVGDYSAMLQNTLTQATADGTLFRVYGVTNASEQGAGYFRWLSLLDTNVIVILILMTFVACVTLISGMLILILDKKNLIGLLRALGMKKSRVKQVFVWLAVRVAVTGMIIGNGLMLALLYCQDRWHFLPLNPEAYYIDFVPVEFNWLAFALLNLGVIVLIYLALILPSSFAARISPSETLKYE